MFDTVHDAILLAIAFLYTLVGISRVGLAGRFPVGHKFPPGWFFVPYVITVTLVVVAILW